MTKRASRNHDSNNSPGMEALTSQDIETIRLALAEDNVFRATVNLKRRETFTHIADRTELLSVVFAGITSVLAFTSTANQGEVASRIISYVAGFCGVIGISLSTFSSYAAREADERLARVNVILKDAGIRAETKDSPPKGGVEPKNNFKDGKEDKEGDDQDVMKLRSARTLAISWSDDVVESKEELEEPNNDSL